MLSYTSLPACHSLSELVQKYVVFEGHLPRNFIWQQNLIPALTEYIFFNLAESAQTFIVENRKIVLYDVLATGQYSVPFVANLTGHLNLIGVAIKTPGLARLFNVPLRYLSNYALSLHDLIGEKATDCYDIVRDKKTIAESVEAIEHLLQELFIRSKCMNQNLLYAHNLIISSSGTKSIKAIAQEIRLSERFLQKSFLNDIGMPPKLYSRVTKFNEVIWHFNAHKKISQDIIHQLGYFDQAHFIHDFKKFSGLSPLEYFKNHPGINEFFTSL